VPLSVDRPAHISTSTRCLLHTGHTPVNDIRDLALDAVQLLHADPAQGFHLGVLLLELYFWVLYVGVCVYVMVSSVHDIGTAFDPTSPNIQKYIHNQTKKTIRQISTYSVDGGLALRDALRVFGPPEVVLQLRSYHHIHDLFRRFIVSEGRDNGGSLSQGRRR
jgi:hypothetical protein